MSTKTKRIRIPYSGPIYAKGGVYGPITTPYREEIRVIQQLLVSGIPVVEVVDGREINLTLTNYTEDFTKPKETVSKEIVIPVPSDFDKEAAEKEAAEKAKVIEQVRQNQGNKNHNQNKNKEKNQGKQQPVVDEGSSK